MSPRQGSGLRITDATLAELRCPEGRKDMLLFDGSEPGFGVRVTAEGKRVLLFQYRFGELVRRHRIGVWGQGSLTATKGRHEAERLRGLVRIGRDPVAEHREAKAQAVADERHKRATASAEAFTVGRLIEAWETKGVAHRRESYVSDATARLRSYLANLLDRPAGSISKLEVIQTIDQVETDRGTTSARRGLAYARAAYGWALKRGMVDANPFAGIPSPGKENPRDRVLTSAEIGAVWRAAGQLEPNQGAFVRVLMLTLQRLEEVAGMTWGELSDDRAIWTIPGERAKNGKAHTVHLAPQVREILAGLPVMVGNPFVFASRRKGHIGGFSAIKRKLVGLMGPIGETDWRFHDFRRTGVTTLANMGIPPHIADKLLNHVTGTIRGVAAVYQRAEFLAERKAALEAWADWTG